MSKLPDFYYFPPFFTIQPVLSTREKQLGQWRELILKYREYMCVCCDFQRQYRCIYIGITFSINSSHQKQTNKRHRPKNQNASSTRMPSIPKLHHPTQSHPL
mmetsp:Transcript_2724/g.4207  ORF Transcript_2724/g.4207 Transcript_2724/m.4207 type:complete len:102 (+) Transcript_2724:423-728(+)